MSKKKNANKTTAPQRPSILVVQLEFQTWEKARAWGYTGHFGIEEGLRGAGLEPTILPAMHELASNAPGAWLRHARELCAGKQFDYAWICLVHSHYDPDFMNWFSTVAPVRIGWLGESLSYTPEEITQWPWLSERRALVEAQIQNLNLTHILTVDETDADYLNGKGVVPSIFWATGLPERYLKGPLSAPKHEAAAFFGSLYGERGAWLEKPELKGRLVRPEPPENQFGLTERFDILNQENVSRLQNGPLPTEEDLNTYVAALRDVRRGTFDAWMQGIQGWQAIVNLPSFGKCYTSRVQEAMAAGVPSISWDIPNRPRNRALFASNEEILLYNREEPAELATHIERLQKDPLFRQRLVENARRRMLEYHTMEGRIRQVLRWVESGEEPDYGERTAEFVPAEIPVTPEPPHTAPAPAPVLESSMSNAPHSEQDAYYVALFIHNPDWSQPTPNPDEQARWSIIEGFLKEVAASKGQSLRILDLGCGRGWMTNLASRYGTCDGVDPVALVIEAARRHFPTLRFTAGDANTILSQPDFQPYDVVLNSEVIEHIPNEEKSDYIRTIRRLLKPGGTAILTTPRQEAQETWRKVQADPNQPVEDWLSEERLRSLFTAEGFGVQNQGRLYFNQHIQRRFDFDDYRLTPTDTTGDLLPLYQVWSFRASKTPIAETPSRPTPKAVPAPSFAKKEGFRVVALIAAHNEGDVISAVIGDLIYQGLEVYLIDNSSTDNTVAEAEKWLGKGLLHIERFPQDSGSTQRAEKEYIWRDILHRKQILATELGADWYIHTDADEFRESPWPDKNLYEGIREVDTLGYNAINFELLNFRPTDNSFPPGADVRDYLTAYEPGDWFDAIQIKAWKQPAEMVDIVSNAGHQPLFAGRSVFPIPFLLRHYPIRSEAHGQKKVYEERMKRFAAEEKAIGWHVQYDALVASGKSFLYSPETLVPYDGNAVRAMLLSRTSRNLLLSQKLHNWDLADGNLNGDALGSWCSRLLGLPNPLPVSTIQECIQGIQQVLPHITREKQEPDIQVNAESASSLYAVAKMLAVQQTLTGDSFAGGQLEKLAAALRKRCTNPEIFAEEGIPRYPEEFHTRAQRRDESGQWSVDSEQKAFAEGTSASRPQDGQAQAFQTGTSVPGSSHPARQREQEQLPALNAIKTDANHDTDKSEDFLARYEEYFRSYKNDPIRLFELGVFHGGSLTLWRDYFPNGTIVGLDMDPIKIDDTSGRIHLYQGLQQDTALLDRIAKECAPEGFDIIIDDASHFGDLTRITFWHLFDRWLKPGGLFIIEDWGTGYWDVWPDGKPYQQGKNHLEGMVGFIKELIDECGMGDITHPKFGNGLNIESKFLRMQITHGQVVIEKRGGSRSLFYSKPEESGQWSVDSEQKALAEGTSASRPQDDQAQAFQTGTSVPGSSSVRTVRDTAAPQTGTSVPPLSARQPAPAVTIITPVYNKSEYTKQCIENLFQNTPVSQNYELVVVDNASSDDTPSVLRGLAGRFPGLKFVRSETNLGFAGANNRIARQSPNPYVLFLNNDTIPQPGWLEAMVRTMESDPKIGIVGSRLLFPEGTVQHAGIWIDAQGMPFHIHAKLPGDSPEVLQPRDMPAVTGACLMIRRDLFMQLGGFDETYPMYFEDVELCLQAWKAGYRVTYCPESVVTHFESVSSTDVTTRNEKWYAGWSIFQQRWVNRWPAQVSQVLSGQWSVDSGQKVRAEGTTASLPQAQAFQSGTSVPGSSSVRTLSDAGAPQTASNSTGGNRSRTALSLLYHAPITDPSGFAEEARTFIGALDSAGAEILLSPIQWSERTVELTAHQQERFASMCRQSTPGSGNHLVNLWHVFPPSTFRTENRAELNVCRVMFDTDRLPLDWVTGCNRMDEVWVPTEHNLQSFAKAGVDPNKLVKIPGMIDTERFDPARNIAPLVIENSRGFNFLSVFDWQRRKGWETLLKAYVQTFKPEENVALVLKTHSSFGKTTEEIGEEIVAFLTSLGCDMNKIPDIVLHDQNLSTEQMPALYKACDAFVLPSHSEGWGYPYMEAMAMGLPTIGTAWSGNLEFMNAENSYLIEIEGLEEVSGTDLAELPGYAGHQWAVPSEKHLKTLLREVFTNREKAKEVGRKASQYVRTEFSQQAVAAKIMAHLESRLGTSLESRANVQGHTEKGNGQGTAGNGQHNASPLTTDNRSLNPASPRSMRQKYSLYHTEGREESLKAWMAPYADLFRESRKVLDIGCGPGLFLELLRERNIPAHGIDYDPIMVDMCRDKGLSASISDARSLISEEPEFDGVHLGHVVEHMDGPTMVNLLEECAQLLRPGGQILIRTPNWNNETVRGGGFWLDHTHVRPYPLELLDRILSDMGLVVTNKGYEEGGWQDTVIVARRPDVPPFAEALDAIASELRPNTVGQRR